MEKGMQEGFICILDALGTKGIWNRSDIGEYLVGLSEVHEHLNQIKSHGDVTLGKGVWDYITVSDTIIITMTPQVFDRALGNHALLPAFGRMVEGVFGLCLEHKIFMRGAISYGQFIQKDSIIVGPAVDDAAMYHERPDMIGVILTPNTTLLAEAGIELFPKDDKMRQYLIMYDTPLKGGKSLRLFQVNWPVTRASVKDTISPLASVKQLFGKNPIPEEAYSKYENTLKFFEFCTGEV